jgi:nitroreductase
MDLLGLSIDDVLTTTRNVRRRLDFDRPVDRSIVEECLNLAVQAPNGSNNQGWEWIAVDDPGIRSQLADLHRQGLQAFLDHLDRHPAARSEPDIGRNERVREIGESVRYLIERMQDVPVLIVPTMHTPTRVEGLNAFYQASLWGSVIQAVWSFMLALRARGLGSAWTTLQLWCERETAELLGIPYEKYTQVGLFPVAYTIGTDFRPAQRRPAGEVLHWNNW